MLCELQEIFFDRVRMGRACIGLLAYQRRGGTWGRWAGTSGTQEPGDLIDRTG